MLLTILAVVVLVVATARAYFAVRSALRQPQPEAVRVGGGGTVAAPDVRPTIKRVVRAAGPPTFVAGMAAGYLLAQTGWVPPFFGAKVLVYIGTDAKAGDFPFAAAMMRNEEAECGGTLFRLEGMPVGAGPQWVLTAAHCYPDKASGFAFGNVDLAKMPPPAPIDRVCVNPQLDAALARLRDVRVQSFAAVLRTVSFEPSSKIEILGWGETYKKETTVLQHATLNFVAAKPCGHVTSDACFTAVSPKAASVCSGDSGSPALLGWTQGQQSPVVAGFAGTISSCGGNKSHFVGTSSLIGWIKQQTDDPSTCKAL
jgi:hypothetical protein